MVCDFSHRAAGVCGTFAGLRVVDPRPSSGDQLLHPGWTSPKRQIATPFRWVTTALATPLLVLRTSRSLHRHPAIDRHHRDDSAGIYAQAASWPKGAHRKHGRDRISQLHGVGPPHVCERHESFFGDHFLGADLDHHHTRDDYDVAAHSFAIRRENALRHAGAILPWIHFCLYQRRHQRLLPGAAFVGHISSRNVFRRGALSFRHGGCVAFRCFRRVVFLVSEDVWPHDERITGKVAFLADISWRLLRFHADALSRTGG